MPCSFAAQIREKSKEHPKKVPESLNSNNCTRNSFLIPHAGCVKGFQALPSTTTQVGKQAAVVKKIPPQNFGDAQYRMSVRNRFDDLMTQPFTEFHHPFLMTGWTEMATFARMGQQILMTAIIASDTRKTVMQNSAVQISINHLPNIRTVESILPLKPVLVDLFKRFKTCPVKCRFVALLRRI